MSMRKDKPSHYKYGMDFTDAEVDSFNDSFGKVIQIRWNLTNLDEKDDTEYIAVYPTSGQTMLFNKIQFEQFVNKLIEIKENWK